MVKEKTKISTAKKTLGSVQENNSKNVESSTGIMILRSRRQKGGADENPENTGEEVEENDEGENSKNNDDDNNNTIEKFIECGTPPPKSPINSTRGENEQFLVL